MISLRAARPDDVDALIALWQVAGENDARPVDTPEAVVRLLACDPEACIVADLDGRLVGSLIAGWDGWRAHLYRLAVHPDVRRQGLAGRLLAEAEKRLVTLGAGRLDAMVLEGNELGRSLWRSAGYTPQAEWRRWVKPV